MAKRKGFEHITALYERLSRDDEQQGESNSISNQKQYLEDYAVKNGFGNIKHYTDDGFTGRNFKRPGFQQMLEDIEADKVGIVIVKDMSRFGRNYLQVGFYTDMMFPKKNVRFIAINSNVDTNSDNPNQNDFAPFLNIMNEWYAKDTSNKIKTVFDARMRAGKRCSPSVPYGYYRSPVDKQQLLADPVSSKVVVRIFELMAGGKNTGQITDILTEEKILVPSAYANEYHKEQGNGIVPKNPYQWNRTTVLDILKRKEYLGHTILKKSVSVNFKTDERRLTTEDEQYFFENTHEPIVTQELWDKAQRNRRIVERKRINDNIKASAVFLGLLYCADCDSKLVIKILENDNTGHIIIAYNCVGYGGKSGRCSAHYINENDLKTLLLEYIRLISKRIIEDEDSFVKELKEKWKEKQSAAPKQVKTELKAYTSRYNELDELISGLYENFVAGLLPERQYKSLMKKYDDEQKEVEQKIEELSSQVEQKKAPSIKAEHFVELIKKYKNPKEITREMARELIDKIVVYKPVGKKPNRTQQIDIYFNFIGKFDLTYTQEELNEKRLQAEKEAREKTERQIQTKKDYQRAYRAKKRSKQYADNDGHPYPQRECACCGKLFYPTHAAKKYCSDECDEQAKKERYERQKAKRRTSDKLEERTCKICGKKFKPRNRQETLCSPECKRANQNLLKRKYYQRKKEKEKPLCKDLLQTKEQVSDTNSSEITIIPA